MAKSKHKTKKNNSNINYTRNSEQIINKQDKEKQLKEPNLISSKMHTENITSNKHVTTSEKYVKKNSKPLITQSSFSKEKIKKNNFSYHCFFRNIL